MSSSIHIQKASGGSVHHNSRENFSHSVVFTDEKNEVWNNAKDSFTIYRDELKIRSEAYSNSTGQKLQSRAVTQLSAVLNLEQHHTLKDLEKIKDYLEKEFDTKVFQMAIHRDEGKIKHKETGNYLVSGTDFFLNPKDNNLYYDKKYTKPLNLENYTIEKNYHAHIEMMGLKSNGKAIRQDMNKFKLSKLQDFVAESLQMERGKNYRIEKSSKRLDTHEFKAKAKIINETKKDLVSEKELKKQIQELKKELQEEKAKRPDYAKLEDMNKTLLEGVKEKTLTISNFKIEIDTYKKEREQLKKEIDNLTVKNKDNIERLIKRDKEIIDLKSLTKNLAAESVSNFKEAEKYKEKVNTLENQNKSLQEEIKQKPIQTIQNNQTEVLNYFRAESELSQDFYSMIEKREFKTGLMSKEDFTIIKKQEVGTPTILEVMKSHFKKMYNSLQEKIRLLTFDNANLKKANLELQRENLKLTADINKYKTLSITGTGEKKENLFERVRKINENEKIFKEEMKKEKIQEEVKENTIPKKQNYGYELG